MPKQTFFNLPGEKQERIISCAVEEFAGNGYEKASISRLVKAAGIAKGSFYQYFEDKEDLYGFLIEELIVRRKQRISSEEEPKLEELNLTGFIRTLFHTMLREFNRYPQVLKISLDFVRNQEEPVQKRIRSRYTHLQDRYYQGFIAAEQARGEIDAHIDVDILAGMLLGASYQLVSDVTNHGYEILTDTYIDHLADQIEYILTHGIYRNTE